MARAKKKIKEADIPMLGDAPIDPKSYLADKETTEDKPRVLPFSLRRELEEIQKNSGRVIDFTLPIEELEKICNRANNPPDSWRDRWVE